MEFMMENIGKIVIAAVALGVLAVAPAVFADKSAAIETEEDREFIKPGSISCGFNCSSCSNADTCTKPGRQEL